MKVILIVSCLLVGTHGVSQEFTDQVLDRIATAMQKCIPIVGANENDVSEVLKRIPSSREASCLAHCVQKEMNLFGSNRRPSPQGYRDLVEPLRDDDPEVREKMHQMVDICESEMRVIKADECELAALALACFNKYAIEMNIDPDSILG